MIEVNDVGQPDDRTMRGRLPHPIVVTDQTASKNQSGDAHHFAEMFLEVAARGDRIVLAIDYKSEIATKTVLDKRLSYALWQKRWPAVLTTDRLELTQKCLRGRRRSRQDDRPAIARMDRRSDPVR